MSEMRFKFAIRTHLPELHRLPKIEVLAFFKSRVGEPHDYLDDLDWHYDCDELKLCPVRATDSNEWGIDYILESSYASDCSESCIDVGRLPEIMTEIKKSFPQCGDSKIVVYSWYTGVDEPVSFMLFDSYKSRQE